MGICNPGIHIPTPARIFIRDSVCVVLIKILLAHIANPVKHLCLTERQTKQAQKQKHEDKHRTQHMDYNSTSIQQSTNNLRAKLLVLGYVVLSSYRGWTDRLTYSQNHLTAWLRSCRGMAWLGLSRRTKTEPISIFIVRQHYGLGFDYSGCGWYWSKQMLLVDLVKSLVEGDDVWPRPQHRLRG